VSGVALEPAMRADVPLIHGMVCELAEYERLDEQVVGTAEALEHHLFGPDPAAEVVLAKADGEPVGFALFFTTFSTFLSQPGLWLEDLFVRIIRTAAVHRWPDRSSGVTLQRAPT
jgi:hypothetical protein